MNSTSSSRELKGTGPSMGWAVVLIIAGFFALALPLAAGIAIAIVVAAIIIAAGIAHLAGALAARTTGGFIWRLLVGGAYVIAGIYLLLHPALNLLSLTLALAILFFVEGVFHLATYFHVRKLAGSGWILFDAVVTILLAFLIWRSWPSSAIWAVGTLVGVNLLISGFTRWMYLLAWRRAAPPAAP